eukprot:Hpha_TRINITY_DN10712_c0_g2::TRINITY_DN10712_c0_g2_i1::g.43573::m.43573
MAAPLVPTLQVSGLQPPPDAQRSPRSPAGISHRLSQRFGFALASDCTITRVDPWTPAAEAGMDRFVKNGTVVSINGQEVRQLSEVSPYLQDDSLFLAVKSIAEDGTLSNNHITVSCAQTLMAWGLDLNDDLSIKTYRVGSPAANAVVNWVVSNFRLESVSGHILTSRDAEVQGEDVSNLEFEPRDVLKAKWMQAEPGHSAGPAPQPQVEEDLTRAQAEIERLREELQRVKRRAASDVERLEGELVEARAEAVRHRGRAAKSLQETEAEAHNEAEQLRDELEALKGYYTGALLAEQEKVQSSGKRVRELESQLEESRAAAAEAESLALRVKGRVGEQHLASPPSRPFLSPRDTSPPVSPRSPYGVGSVGSLSPSLRPCSQLGFKLNRECIITSVVPGTPAALAGLDRFEGCGKVLSVNHSKVTRASDLARFIQGSQDELILELGVLEEGSITAHEFVTVSRQATSGLEMSARSEGPPMSDLARGEMDELRALVKEQREVNKALREELRVIKLSASDLAAAREEEEELHRASDKLRQELLKGQAMQVAESTKPSGEADTAKLQRQIETLQREVELLRTQADGSETDRARLAAAEEARALRSGELEAELVKEKGEVERLRQIISDSVEQQTDAERRAHKHLDEVDKLRRQRDDLIAEHQTRLAHQGGANSSLEMQLETARSAAAEARAESRSLRTQLAELQSTTADGRSSKSPDASSKAPNLLRGASVGRASSEASSNGERSRLAATGGDAELMASVAELRNRVSSLRGEVDRCQQGLRSGSRPKAGQ